MRPPSLPGSYLVVETTNRCSLACVHCSVSEPGHPHHAETGFLDPELFAALTADLARVGARFDTLILFWLGEPHIHAAFGDIWRAAVRAGARDRVFGKIELHTNATHLLPDRVRAALNDADVPQVWHFSLDAATQPTYLAVKARDRLAVVEENITAFLAAKARLGARWPRPVFQFIVGSNNADEASEFRRVWEERCRAVGLPVRAAAGHVPAGEDAVVFFRQLDCPTDALQDRENAVFADTMARMGLALPPVVAHRHGGVQAQNMSICSGFWKSPVVGWNGDVTVCTRDNRFENAVGNLRDVPFSALWWGPQMAARRARVAGGDYGGLPPCATCFIPRSLNYTALDPEDVAQQAAFDAGRRAG